MIVAEIEALQTRVDRLENEITVCELQIRVLSECEPIAGTKQRIAEMQEELRTMKFHLATSASYLAYLRRIYS